MAKPLPIALPFSNTIEQLRQHLVVALNSISIRLAQQDNRTAPMSMGGNRLTDVPDPSNALDAVNLRSLKKAIQGVSQNHEKGAVGEHYTIVWSNNGTATGTAPPYIINQFRTGTPNITRLYALGTGTGSTTLNIYYVAGGTGTPTKLLGSDISLPANVNGPISQTGFNVNNFGVNDVLYAVVTTAGGASNLSLELLVNP